MNKNSYLNSTRFESPSSLAIIYQGKFVFEKMNDLTSSTVQVVPAKLNQFHGHGRISNNSPSQVKMSRLLASNLPTFSYRFYRFIFQL